jgi:hypothetical protein
MYNAPRTHEAWKLYCNGVLVVLISMHLVIDNDSLCLLILDYFGYLTFEKSFAIDNTMKVHYCTNLLNNYAKYYVLVVMIVLLRRIRTTKATPY